ncbi:MAG: MFS transporter [Pseudohongiellaceae bacterium]
MQNKLHRNINLIYGLAFFHSFMVIVPVIVPFFMDKGLSLADIFYLQAVFATAIVVFEAPSGYFADVCGRKTALVLGGIIHGAGYFYLNFADELGSLIIFEITVGIAASLLSGADLALLYDTQKALEGDEEIEHSKAISHLGFFRSSSEGLGALAGGALVIWSFDATVVVQSAAAWMCLVLALLIIEPPYKKAGDDSKRIQISAILRHLFTSDPVLRNVVIAIPLYSLATFHVAWLMQPYWEAQGISLAMFGLLWFSQSLVVATAARFGFVVERRHGAVFSLVLMGLLPIAGHFGMAWAQGWPGILIGLLLFACRGLNQVILVNAMNRRIPSEFRATANSFTSFLFRLAFITTGPVVGYLAETKGLGMTLNVLGLSSIALFVFVMMPLIQSVKAIPQQVAA